MIRPIEPCPAVTAPRTPARLGVILALAVLTATPAFAEDRPAVESARVFVLQDLIAGRFRDVRKESREVEFIRGGAEYAATNGFVLKLEDAIRTRRGRVVVELLDGGRIMVGKGSQVRLDPAAGWLHRLGTLDAVLVGPARFTVGHVVVDAADADVRITRTLAGDGEVTVLRGSITISIGAAEPVILAGPSKAIFTQEAITATAPLDPEVLAELIAERDVAPAVPGRVERDPAGAHLRFHGGVSRIHGADFGRVGLSARIRLTGPLFVAFGGGFAFRPVDEDLSIESAFVVPAHAGIRVVAALPRAFMLMGGIDFTAFVGEWCAGTGCTTDIQFEPGARLLVGTGLEIADVVGLDVSLAAGVIRRRIPASVDPATPVVPELQIHFEFGVFFRLP
jgi:hypothetical protein